MAYEGLSGCCAAYNHYGMKIHKAEDIPAKMLQVNFFWFDKDDKESIDFLSPYAKSKIETATQVVLTCDSDKLTEARNKALLDELNAEAVKHGRKNAQDFRVGDGVGNVISPNAAKDWLREYGSPKLRIKTLKSNHYGDKGFYLESFDSYYKSWQDLGEYQRVSFVIISFAEDK